jgi:SHS family lactate transporter-like MFS transporter
LLVLPVLKLWAFSDTLLLLGAGAFAVQFMVQGAWGVVPVHLNELSPDAIRATLPGLTYQTGNFISSLTPWLLTLFAEHNGNQYGLAMATFIAGVAIALALVTWLGPEAKGKRFGSDVAADSL